MLCFGSACNNNNKINGRIMRFKKIFGMLQLKSDWKLQRLSAHDLLLAAFRSSYDNIICIIIRLLLSAT